MAEERSVCPNNGCSTSLFVNVYYSAVQDAFTSLNEERILRYKPFCLQVRITYMNLNDMGLSQDEILKKWLIGYKMPPMRIEAHVK